MVGLLKAAKLCTGHDKRRSGWDFLQFEDPANTTNYLQGHSIMDEDGKGNSSQDMALSHGCSNRGKIELEKQLKDVCFHSSRLANQSKVLTEGKPSKRKRIVSVRRHKFEPFISKSNLLNRRFVRRYSVPQVKVCSVEISKKFQFSDHCGKTNQAQSEVCGGYCNAICGSCNKCCHYVSQFDAALTRHIPSETVNQLEKSSRCCESSSEHAACSVNFKKDDFERQPKRQSFCPSQIEGSMPKEKSNLNSYRVNNSKITGHRTVTKEKGLTSGSKDDRGCEIEAGRFRESARVFHSSGDEIEDGNKKLWDAGGNDTWRGRRESTTLKVFVADEGNDSKNVSPKQLFMPPSERLKCLKFNPGQYFDIVFEELPVDELKRFISEVSGKESHSTKSFESLNTKEKFVKELKSIFSRLSSLEEERFKERDIFEMILLAKAYCDKYEREIKEERNSKFSEDSKIDDKRVKLSSEGAPITRQMPLEIQSNTFSGNTNYGYRYEFAGFQPIKDKEQGDSSLVDNGEQTIMPELQCKKNPVYKQSTTFSSILRGICKKDKSSVTWKPQKLSNFYVEGNLLENHTVQCSDVALKNDMKSRREQQDVLVKAEKRRRKSMREIRSCSSKYCNECSTCNSISEYITPRWKLCTSVVKEADVNEADAKEADVMEADVNEADAKEADIMEVDAKELGAKEAGVKEANSMQATRTSLRKSSVSSDESTLKRRRCEIEEEDKVGSCRTEGNEYQKGAGKEDVTTKLLVEPREISSQDKIVIADALLSLQGCQPIPTDVREILLSRSDTIAEFTLLETAKFYRQVLISFMQEKQKIASVYYKERLKMLKKEKEKEFAEQTEKIVEGGKRDIDLKFHCEMELTNQFFRQELWIRIQKCVCGKVGQLSCCGRCNSTFYCSKRCQVVDFKDHKVVCKEEKL